MDADEKGGRHGEGMKGMGEREHRELKRVREGGMGKREGGRLQLCVGSDR